MKSTLMEVIGLTVLTIGLVIGTIGVMSTSLLDITLISEMSDEDWYHAIHMVIIPMIVGAMALLTGIVILSCNWR